MLDLNRGTAIDLVRRLCKGVFSTSAADWVFYLLIILGDDTSTGFSIGLFTGTALDFLGSDLVDYDFEMSKVLVDCDVGAASTIFLLVTITFFFGCGCV